VKSYAKAFRVAGGTLELHIVEGIPENGHWLPRYRDQWEPFVDPFLAPPNKSLERTRGR